mmetsp:Transcript_122248/g.280003  ORF Transcript_122248/g.280003 Transcript_122248/m.280003 type:complete len:450 (-) Transcript_122248:321-1670(-)
MPAVHFAIEAGHVPVLEVLFEFRARVDVETSEGVSALVQAERRAAMRGAKPEARDVLECVRSRVAQVLDLLVTASESNDMKGVENALSLGADPNGARGDTTPLASAVRSQHATIVQRLLEAKAQATPEVLVDAACAGNSGLCEMLVKAGSGSPQRPTLEGAAAGGHQDLLVWLLEQADPALQQAVQVEIAEAAVAAPAGEFPETALAETLHGRVLLSWLQGPLKPAEASSKVASLPAVSDAASLSHLFLSSIRAGGVAHFGTLVTLFGVDPNAALDRGAAPVWVAVETHGGDAAVPAVRELLALGADPAAQKGGVNLAHWAAEREKAELLGLVAVGDALDAAASTKMGRSALGVASAGGSEKAVAVLLGASASVQVRDRDGFTPLDLATAAAHIDICAKLLAAKSDAHDKGNKRKVSAMERAKTMNRSALVAAFIDAGVEVDQPDPVIE